MAEGRRVFSDATQSSPSGCKKLGKHGSRKGAVRPGSAGHTSTAEASTYYYHSDHLGSAHLITDYRGNEYERIEYTPYGEYWVEKRAPENKTLPFKFTGKERDEETGLYYYGARYLEPKTSRWLTADPALGEYMAGSAIGEGGIYNQVNFNLYHYAGNNPIKYTDPTGMFDWETNTIEAGDTLSKITDEFNRKNDTNYTYDDMAKANGIEDPNKIYAGDKLDFSSLLPEKTVATTTLSEKSNNTLDNMLNSFERPIDDIGNFSTYAYEGLKLFGNDFKFLKKISNIFGNISLGYDLKNFFQDPMLSENQQNLMTDIAGKIHPYYGFGLQVYYSYVNYSLNSDSSKNAFNLLENNLLSGSYGCKIGW
ncbi:LysM peptidoglycan-binding domain-containing protein [Treponema sp. OMZ 840]|uniref:RHS repeat-associated core domain-containing protein n=1 Tax=Treponema sp. OMZ 840 TaxID=244313 RepID=UPI003D91E643